MYVQRLLLGPSRPDRTAHCGLKRQLIDVVPLKLQVTQAQKPWILRRESERPRESSCKSCLQGNTIWTKRRRLRTRRPSVNSCAERSMPHARPKSSGCTSTRGSTITCVGKSRCRTHDCRERRPEDRRIDYTATPEAWRRIQCRASTEPDIDLTFCRVDHVANSV